MKNFTVKLVELGNPFLDIVDVRWGRFHGNEQAYNDFLVLAHQYFAKADVITVDDGCLLSSWSFDNEVFETSYESEGDLYEVSLDFEMIKAFKVGDGVFSVIAPNGYTYDFAFFSLTKLSLDDV